jgi:hypothetical protein
MTAWPLKVHFYIFWRFKHRLWKNDRSSPPHEKVSPFLNTMFLVNGIDNPLSNLIYQQRYFLSINWCQESLVHVDELLLMITLQLIAFLGPFVAFTDAYNIKVYRFWYPSIVIHCIVLLVKFEGVLSISVLRNKQLFTNSPLINRKGFLKRSNAAHCISNTRLFSNTCALQWVMTLSEFKRTGRQHEKKSRRWFQVGFIESMLLWWS